MVVAVPQGPPGSATGPPRHCRKRPVALQQGRCHNPRRPLRQENGSFSGHFSPSQTRHFPRSRRAVRPSRLLRPAFSCHFPPVRRRPSRPKRPPRVAMTLWNEDFSGDSFVNIFKQSVTIPKHRLRASRCARSVRQRHIFPVLQS